MSQDELRFGFGQNWAEFIEKNLSDSIVEDSINHMKSFMKRETLEGLRILDIGCGSGIHSLAMKRLGAKEVVAFDYDVNSVETSKKVREWSGMSEGWHIEQGSVLDKAYMESLGKFDVVYSWGVLHHTGSMWEAVKNATIPLNKDSEFYIALYSSDTYIDPPPEEWIRIKKAYNYASPVKKKLMELHHLYRQVIAPEIKAGRNFVDAIKNYGSRGMNIWADIKDWLGGYPMEFASLQETRTFIADEIGFNLVNVINGEGCTEYLFANPAENSHWQQVEAGRYIQSVEGPIEPVGGYGFKFALPELSDVADDNGFNMRSKLMLYENGKPLGLAHCMHAVIRDRGNGRFSHWQGEVVFSASDNTDPRASGHYYGFCANY